uniref:C-type lectin domain-containing protein n=1 Tax=Electrophorus electricus TaxID=8005 RepID=A0A4W4FBN9_ELEEL
LAQLQSHLRTFHIIGTENLTQSEAQAACKRNYTDLVTVYNKEENTVLANLTKTVYPSTAWIGLYRKHPSYKWSNGEAVTFRNMTENLVTQMCCVMKADGAWDWYQFLSNHFMAAGMYHSYHLVLEKMAWYDAQRYCRVNYTDLVSIRNQKQNEEVMLNGKKSITPFWIGLLCDDWEWADGGLSAYRNWGTGQPRSESDCVCIETSKWISVPCNSYINSALTFHIIGDVSLTQSEAQAVCRRNYTDLVTVHSEEENTVLVNLTKMVYPSTAWIGLYRNQPSCKWSNGDAVTFRNMTGNMTCGTGANCVAMKADGGWETFECTEKRDFMCYKYGN